MSRLSQFKSRFFLNASVPRTYLETLLAFFLLMLLTIVVYQADANQMMITSLPFFVSPCTALYYSLRLRIPQGRWYQRFGKDVLWIAVPTLLFNPLIWVTLRTINAEMYDNTLSVVQFDLLFTFLLAFPYLFFRVAIRFIVWWNDLRQRRIIWTLVTGNLIAVALLQVIVIILSITALFFSDLGARTFSTHSDNPLVQYFYRLQMSLPLVGIAILMATTILIMLLPVSIIVSYFFARRIRWRLDALVDAAHAAGDGNYDTEVIVSGHDEIARLQADFNIMTNNLRITIDALRDEREKVSTLLKNRRELMANVSHELRTPIATVRAYLESALRQQENKDTVTISQSDLAVIQHETLRLQTLVDDLFALSRAEVDQLAMKSAPLDAGALIQRVIETVAPLAWRVNRVEIVSHVPSLLPKAVADETRLEQVLRNLIHNSLRYTSPGGLVIITAREIDGYMEIQVQDTGEGIKPENLPHIWERYYRDSVNGGTGLGLALVKSFIEAMHGQVAVTSTLGEGTCFSITLPIVNTPSEASSPLPKPQSVSPPMASRSPVILS